MATAKFNFDKVLQRLALFLTFALSMAVQDLTAGSLLASWSPVSDSRVAGYKVKYGTQSGSYSQSMDVGNSTSSVVANLTEGTTYFFRVTAYDSNRVEGTPSTEVSAVVLKASNINISSISSSSAVVSWQTNKPATSQVEYGTTTGYGSSTALNTTLTLNATASLPNLSPSTQYHFRVRSKDEGGSVFLSNDLTFTTGANTSLTCDCNKDGTVNTSDLQLVVNAVLVGDNSSSYDITKNGKVDATDLQVLGNVILGVATCP